jgi:hypothetical protein
MSHNGNAVTPHQISIVQVPLTYQWHPYLAPSNRKYEALFNQILKKINYCRFLKDFLQYRITGSYAARNWCLYPSGGNTVKGAAHRTRPSAAACGQKSVFYCTISGKQRPDAAAGGWPLVSVSVLYLKTVCPRGLFKMDTEIPQNNPLTCENRLKNVSS